MNPQEIDNSQAEQDARYNIRIEKAKKHTPGPWKFYLKQLAIDPNDSDKGYMTKKDYHEIATEQAFYEFKTGEGFGITGYINESNAQLIAMAPELLKEVEELKMEVLRLKADYSKLTPEQIEDQNFFDLKELRHYYGSWKQLKVVIENLEQEEDEANYERHMTDY